MKSGIVLDIILSFADNTTAYISRSKIDTLVQETNSSLEKLNDFVCANKLSPNIDDTICDL